MPRNYYEILNVPPDATQEEIKQAYRRLAREYHPDVRREDPAAEERFKEINEAYQVLGDPEKRAEYDRMLRGVPAPEDFGFVSPFEDLFDAFFGPTRPVRRESAPERGADLRLDLELTLEEAAHGTERTVEIRRLETCPGCFGTGSERGGGPAPCPTCGGTGQTRFSQRTVFGTFTQITTCRRCGGRGRILRDPCGRCRGTGRVEATRSIVVSVPAGVEDGTRLRIAGEGEAGRWGGQRGDLYVVVHLAPHPVFERRGLDLSCTVPITMTQAALGAEIEVPTLDGPQPVVVPAGTQPGSVLTLRGRGMPSLDGRRGDLHVRFEVRIPTQLSREERRLLLEFARLRGERVKPSRRLLDQVKDLLS